MVGNADGHKLRMGKQNLARKLHVMETVGSMRMCISQGWKIKANFISNFNLRAFSFCKSP
jgi:ribulose bisphosphate carboxylase small subunit